ncbi:hypothetical protein FQ085_12765 [Planococcus sp. ANT_H30]|uniref:hypothetical protein n=1 Tax=Planococcus sp. ANT_H30 TaxID=2597347 RepID=UPI0011EE448D|nr:hypothetical protein [Planococcus sp. ANT_H30]KAA0956374.1 hypothetical protein FQ085_12765 [Planococcus sp. ANT_H30]
MKRFFYYFIWTLVIGFLIYLGLYFQEQLVTKSQTTFTLYPLRAYIILFPIIIGLLLRTPKFILEIKERQNHSFDWIKFIAVGLPVFVILVFSFMHYLPNSESWTPVFNMNINLILYSGTTLPTIAGLIFGYVLLDSFKNKDSVRFYK